MKALLALAAVPLLLPLGACTPTPTEGSGTTDLGQLARAVINDEYAVTPADLADRILQRREDHVLIDLRPAPAFDATHIKTAQRFDLPQLLDPAGRAALPPAHALIVYAEEGGPSAQAAALLRIAGLDAYYLQGGYRGWQNQLHGEPPPATPQEAAKRAAVACWFEGDYVAAAGLAVKGVASPAPAAYTPPLQPATPPAAAPAAPDPLGLGLDLGLGPETKPAAPAPGRLKVGEGC